MNEADVADEAQRVIRAEPKLWEGTYQAANDFMLYSAANNALADGQMPSGHTFQLARVYREPAVLMTVIRVYALFDRGAEVSFQTVKDSLKKPEVRKHLVDVFAYRNETSRSRLEAESNGYADTYLKTYADGFDRQLFKRLHHFRNIGLAHLTLGDVTKWVKYGELEHLVRFASTLVVPLALLVRSHKVHPLEYLDAGTKQWTSVWRGRIQHDLQERQSAALSLNTKLP